MKYELITWTHQGRIMGYGALIINGKKRNPLYNGEADDFKWPDEKSARQAAKSFITNHQPNLSPLEGARG